MSRTRLADLGTEARRLEHLREAVRGQLPTELAPWCLGAELQNDTLLVFMASAATATAVRYRQQGLLEAVGTVLDARPGRLEVRVMPDPPLPPTPRPTPRTLSDNIRRLLEQTAEGIADTSLARSLRHLARSRGRSHD